MSAKKANSPKKNIPSSPHAPFVVLVSSGKGGSGKTTLARNILSYASAEGLSVAGLDLDEQLSLRTWSDVRDETIASVGAESVKGIREIPVEAVDYENGVKVLDQMKRLDLDLIVIDTPSGYQTGDLMAVLPALVGRSDMILVPCKQSATDTRAVLSWYREVLHETPKASMILMGVRRKSRSCDLASNMLAETGEVCPIIIRDLEIYRTTDQLGLGVNESDSNSSREKDPDFDSLWRWIYRKGLNALRKKENV